MTTSRTRSLLLGSAIAAVAVLAAVGAGLVAAGSAGDDPEVASRGAAGSGAQAVADEPGQLTDPGDNPLVHGPSSAEGEPVPDLTFELLDGGSSSFAAYRGTPLVVNFFASWCPPCVAEMPGLEQVHQRLGDRVAFVGLAMRDTADDARALVDRTGVTYDTGHDPRGDILSAFDGVAIPTTVFVSAQGTVVDVHAGELSAGELQRRIEELLL